MANKKRTQNKRIKRAGKKQRRRTAAKQRGGDYTYKTNIMYINRPIKTIIHATEEDFVKTCEYYKKKIWETSIEIESGNVKVCNIQEL
jgi:hypothetical protein